MPDEIGQEPTTETEAPVETTETPTQAPEGNSPPAEQSQPNPFWGEVQKIVPDSVYRTIKPHLDKADAEANRRISELNERYTPWKTFADEGRKPEDVTRAFSVVERLNDPEYQVQLYESLGNFLRENGRLPNEAELQQQVVEDEDSDNVEEDDPRDAQIQALEAQQQQVIEFLQTQFEQQQAAEAETWLNSEIDKLKQDHPTYSEEDVKEVVRIASAALSQGQEISFEKAAQHFDSLTQRIRTAPRPNDLAPRLPSGVGGGTPSAGEPTNRAMTPQERREAVVARLSANRQ